MYRVTKYLKGFRRLRVKLCHHISEISKWHRTTKKIDPADMIISNTGATWRFKSGAVDSQQTYTVEKLGDPCDTR